MARYATVEQARAAMYGAVQPSAKRPAAQTTAPTMIEVRALDAPPTLVKIANMAATKTPALPKADATSTRSFIRSEVRASANATMLRAITVNRTAISFPWASRVGMNRATMLCETCDAGACSAECTVDKIAEINAPTNKT